MGVRFARSEIMTKNNNLSVSELHALFISSLGANVLKHSFLESKPLEIELLPPLPYKGRTYLYNATSPPGGRSLGEHKIQLIVPGQVRGEVGSFDASDGRMILLIGYVEPSDVFVLWDAGFYPTFTYSRNIQVMAKTVYAAVAGRIAEQKRCIRGSGTEIVIAVNRQNLVEGLKRRKELSLARIIGNYAEA
jgi:hypothetical protein